MKRIIFVLVFFCAMTAAWGTPQQPQPFLPTQFSGWRIEGTPRLSDDPTAADAAYAAVLEEYGFQEVESAIYTRPDRQLTVKAARFNDASGKGYELVANAVIEIDGFNPQIASRLLGAFESWRILEPQRKGLAEAALRRVLAKKDLSRDVFEIATKIVGEQPAKVAA